MTLRVVHLADGPTILLDVAMWAGVQVASGYLVHRLPLESITRDRGVLRLRDWEREGRLYQRVRIKAWKDRLPEAGQVFRGGVTKRRIPSEHDGGVARLACETRRAELAHWLPLATLPLFVLFNPPRAVPLLLAYGIATNVPCIAVQRYNRIRASRIVERSGHGCREDAAARRRSPAGTTGRSMP
jgi:glycosyl-4,4'-diaponeurosporenoate acyltransferase